MDKLKTIIHVNQYIIRSNKKNNLNNPPLTIKTYKENRKAHIAQIIYNNTILATIKYTPEKPLSCGATCYIETNCEVICD